MRTGLQQELRAKDSERRLHTLDHKRPMLIWRLVLIQACPEQEWQIDKTISFTSDRFTAPKCERSWKKVVMTEMQKAHQNLVVKVRQEKQTDHFCISFKKGSCQTGNSCNYWHVPECSKFQSPPGCKFGDKGVHKHTQLYLLIKCKKPATTAVHITAVDDRQLPKVRSYDKTQFRVTVCSEKGNIGTYTWNHPDTIRKSAKSQRSNIRGKIHRMDLAHGKEIS